MFKRAWRRLFRRHKPKPTMYGISRGLSAYLSTSWRRESVFGQDMADDPGMCTPMASKPTQHITRVIDDQSETLMDDPCETRTMETFIIY